MLVVAKWNGKTIVFSYRNRKWFRSIKDVLEYVLAFLFSNKIVSNNPIEQSSFLYRALYKLKSGTEISNAVLVDSEYIKESSIQRLGDNKPWKILFAGRLRYQKNIETLLKALSTIPVHKWKLCVCGKGVDESELLKLIDTLNIADNLDLKGYCSNVYERMFESDLMILPSRFEGMPNVLVESLKIGLPCIASSILPHRKVLGDSLDWLLFDPESADELADKLNWLMDHPEHAEKMVANGKNIAEQYSELNMTEKIYTGL